jgi:hypothetical protein
MCGGGHTRLRARGWWSPNSDDWRKGLALCLLCGRVSHNLKAFYDGQATKVNVVDKYTRMCTRSKKIEIMTFKNDGSWEKCPKKVS